MIMSPLVYIVIINFNSWNDSFECIDSCSAMTYDNFRIVLIDNGSDVDLSKDLIGKYPHIEYLRNSHNTGYASGCNVGIDFALNKNAEFVWLLNNDTVVHEDSLSEMMAHCNNLENIGILSPKIYYFQTTDIWSSGGYINKMAMAINYKDEFHGIRSVGFVTGCAMLIPAEVFRQYGLLKDDYFLNVEDWEICQRIINGGKNIYVIGSSVIHHKVSRSKKGGESAPLDVYYTTRNRLYFIDEYYGNLQKLGIYIVFALWWPIWLLKNLLSGKRTIVKPFVRGVLDFSHGIKGFSNYYS